MSTAQVRRLYHHKQHGGELSLGDIGYCVEVCEGKDNEIQQLEQQNQELLDALKNLLYKVTDIRGVDIEEVYAVDECKVAYALITKIEKVA